MDQFNDDFAVPLGIDPSGNPVRPSEAQKKVVYKCPSCSEVLILRQGQIRVHHFSHRGDSECSHESRLHKSAKALILKVIADAIAHTGKKPIILMEHSFCGEVGTAGIAYGITGSKEEHRMPSGRILDVAIFKGEEVELGVEVYVTHRVGESKRAALTCPWIEVDAEQIMEDPLRWYCLQQSRMFSGCVNCARIATARSKPPELPKVYVPQDLKPLIPYVGRSIIHATTLMAEKNVEMCLERLPEVLDCFEFPNGTLQLPSGGVVDPNEFSANLRTDLGQCASLDIFQKKSLLWRMSEYLVSAKPWVKGSTRAEKYKNETLVDEAIGWLTK